MEYINQSEDLEPTLENLVRRVDIPSIPEHLIDRDLAVIESRENVFPRPDFIETIASYKVPDELTDWCQQHFGFPVVVRYLVVKKSLRCHIDYGIAGYKYNFVVDTGGDDVVTSFHDGVDEPFNTIAAHHCEVNNWYRVHISTPHSVNQPDRPRILITAKLRNQK